MNDISESNRYTKDELAIILKAIKLNYPEFEFKKNDRISFSKNELLKNLYSNKKSNEKSRKLNDFKMNETKIIENIRKQVSSEIETVVSVPSIYDMNQIEAKKYVREK